MLSCQILEYQKWPKIKWNTVDGRLLVPLEAWGPGAVNPALMKWAILVWFHCRLSKIDQTRPGSSFSDTSYSSTPTHKHKSSPQQNLQVNLQCCFISKELSLVYQRVQMCLPGCSSADTVRHQDSHHSQRSRLRWHGSQQAASRPSAAIGSGFKDCDRAHH